MLHKGFLLLSVCCLFLISAMESQSALESMAKALLQYPHVPNQLLVKFQDGSLQVYCVPDNKSLAMELAKFLADPEVAYAEPNYLREVAATPNDTDFAAKQWDKRRVYLPASWDLATNAATHVIAIVDSGVEYTHPDLQTNMWQEQGTGYYGADYTGGTGILTDNDPKPDSVNEAHGTNVAGVAGAIGNNATGIAGVVWTGKIMAVKVFKWNGTALAATSADIAAGIKYAADKGAKIINMSLKSPAYSVTELNALVYAKSKGVIVVVAAGNEAKNLDVTPVYPACYASDNIVVVGACDSFDYKASYSNYGNTKVQLFAPGADAVESTTIWTTDWSGTYAGKTGSSMAAPQVAGAMALVWAKYPTLTYLQVITHVCKTADYVAPLAAYSKYDGRLNVATALLPPAVVAGFGKGKGGVQFFRMSSQVNPSRLDMSTNAQSMVVPAQSANSKLVFERKSISVDQAMEIRDLSASQEEAAPERQDRILGWDSLSDEDIKSLALADVTGDGYADLIVGKATSAQVYDIVQQKWAYTITGVFTKIFPLDLNGDGVKELGLISSLGLYVWQKLPTVKLELVFSGKLLDAWYSDVDPDNKNEIVFSADKKGVMLFYKNASNVNTIEQISNLNAGIVGSYKDINGVIAPMAGFGGFGLYTYTYATGIWTQISAQTPVAVISANIDGAGAEEIVASFADDGVQIYQASVWTQLAGTYCQFLARANMDFDTKDEILLGYAGQNLGILKAYYTTQWEGCNLTTLNVQVLGNN